MKSTNDEQFFQQNFILPETVTINKLTFWLCGKTPEELITSEEMIDNRAFTILGRSLLGYGKKIITQYSNFLRLYPSANPLNPSYDNKFRLLIDDPYIEIAFMMMPIKALKEDNKTEAQLNQPISIKLKIEDARAFRKMPPEYLALIMAYEECLHDDLIKLQRIYLKGYSYPPDFEISNPEHRIRLWHDLLYVWIGWDKLLLEKKDYLKVTEDAQIELSDFRQYIKELNKRCGVNIPFPARLLPEKRKEKKKLISPYKAAKPSISAVSSKGKMTVKEAAIHYNKSEPTIRRWIDEGKISAEKDRGGNNWLIPYPPENSKLL